MQEVNEAFDELEEGNEEALKTEYDRQVGGGFLKGGRGDRLPLHTLPLCCVSLACLVQRPWCCLVWPAGAQHDAGCWALLLLNANFVLLPSQVTQLSGLIDLINGDLSKLDRKKLITLCTIDVHARDVLQRLIGKSTKQRAAAQHGMQCA